MVYSKIIRTLALMVIILVASPSFAQDTISLVQSKKAALEYSHNIKNGKLRIDQANSARREAISHYFPSVEAMGVVIYGFDNLIDPVPGLLEEGIDNLYLGAMTVTEPIYAGGKIKTASKLATLQVDVNHIRADQALDSVLLLTEQKYWSVVQLQEQQKVFISSEVYLRELLRQQQDLLAAGLIAKNQLLRVKVELSNLLLEKSRAQNRRKIVLLDLSLYAGLPYDTTMVARDTFLNVTTPQLTYQTPDLNLTRNKNYQLLEKSIEASKLQTRMKKADLLPSVAVGVSGSQVGSFNNDMFSGSFIPLAFGTVSIPISDWWGAGKEQVKQRQIDEKIAANNLKMVQDQLKVAIMQSWYQLLDAHKQIEYALENKEYAEENLEVNRDNYNSGLNNLTDLLEAQNTYQQAESNLIGAYANYEITESVFLYRSNKMDILR